MPPAVDLEKRIRDANSGFEVAGEEAVEQAAAETGVRPARLTLFTVRSLIIVLRLQS